MNNQIPRFENEAKRLDYAMKLAKEWVVTLPPEAIEKYGESSLISDATHDNFLALPDSKELKWEMVPDNEDFKILRAPKKPKQQEPSTTELQHRVLY